jgi:signal transduction histidine kinase
MGQFAPLRYAAKRSEARDSSRSFGSHGRIEALSAPEPPDAELVSLQRSVAGLPDQTALLDTDWGVLAVSTAWAHEGRIGDIAAIRPGDNIRHLSMSWATEGKRSALVLQKAIDDLETGRVSAFHHVFEVSDRLEDARYAVSISRLNFDERDFFTITRCDVSQLSLLAERCRELEASLLQARERERRRIGRELHDSTSQLLVGLKLCLMRMKETSDAAKTSEIVAEMDEIMLDIDQEIRAISFLLHPPRLQGRGLAEALDYMARGFARRSGLEIMVDVEGALPARIPELEAALYRLTQEALANAFRHAAATQVKVRLVTRHDTMVHLLIEDNGVGLVDDMPGAAEPGVGVEGMATRVAELGGRLSLRHNGTGCRLLASIPTSNRHRLAAA